MIIIDSSKAQLNVARPLIFELTTTVSNTTVTLPTSNGYLYNCSIDWGDGGNTTMTAYNSAGRTHIYVTAGTRQVQITGRFEAIYVNNGTFKTYLKKFLKFGTVGVKLLNLYGCTGLTQLPDDGDLCKSLTSLNTTFKSCSNITNWGNIGNWDVSRVSQFIRTFQFCTQFNENIGNWDVGKATNFLEMFDGCSSFNQSLNNWNTGAAFSFDEMFFDCISLNQSFAHFDVRNLNTGYAMFGFSAELEPALTTLNWSNTLIAWAAQDIQIADVTIEANKSYHNAAAQVAIDYLVNTYGWTINDLGIDAALPQAVYGRLYNWHAVTDPDFCPDGCHVPTLAEWQTLSDYLGGNAVSGGHLKETGTTHWYAPNTGADNSSGFTGLGSGNRGLTIFTWLTVGLQCWAADAYSASEGYTVQAGYYDNDDFLTSHFHKGYGGLACRMIYVGSNSTVMDYEGRVYDVITIGTQKWLKQNFACQYLNTGEAIPVVTLQSEWAALTTKGCCSMNNNDSLI